MSSTALFVALNKEGVNVFQLRYTHAKLKLHQFKKSLVFHLGRNSDSAIRKKRVMQIQTFINFNI